MDGPASRKPHALEMKHAYCSVRVYGLIAIDKSLALRPPENFYSELSPCKDTLYFPESFVLAKVRKFATNIPCRTNRRPRNSASTDR